MATTAITPTQLVMNVESVDTLDADGVVATTPSDGWVIAAGNRNGDRLWLKFLVNGSGDTIVIKAGDMPPSLRSGLGDLSIVMAASDVRYICVEAARFMQNDGTILVTCVDAGSKCSAWIMPVSPHTLTT
jgi:hypothetical protein